MTQAEKGRLFRSLHERSFAFVIPNPWDRGTARLLSRLGYEALATTSAGFALSLGTCDYNVQRDDVLAHIAAIVSATDRPVSGDLENGFGDTPEIAAESFRLAAEAGLVGGSIEDSRRGPDDPQYDVEHAADRVRAVVEAVRTLPFPFTVTARAENFIVGQRDLNDTIKRLLAYQEAGADVLYAPGLRTKDEIAAVVGSVDRPVHVLMGIQGVRLDLETLSNIGVKRVSVGSALTRAALGAFLRAAREMQEHGTFAFADEVVTMGELNAMLSD